MPRRLQNRSLWAALFFSLLWLANAVAAQSPLSKIIVGKNQNGQLEVFQVGAEGDLRHRSRDTANGIWSPWRSLGGDVFPNIAITSDTAGKMQAFAISRADGSLEFISQQNPNGAIWTSWTNLGGHFEPEVAAGLDRDGLLEAFAVDAANHEVQRIRQSTSAGQWSFWTRLGGNIESGLTLAHYRNGRLEVFGIEEGTHALTHCWQIRTNSTDAWSKWASLGGDVVPDIAVAQNSVGRLEVFAVNRTNQQAMRNSQVTASTGTTWTGWQSFGGPFKPGIALGQSWDQRIEIYAVNRNDSTIEHRWEDFANASDVWSTWTNLGAVTKSCPAVGCDEDGDLEVFAIDPTNSHAINYRRQISAASDWLDWSSLDQPAFEYTVRSWQVNDGLPDNLVQAIAQTPDGYLWVGTRMGLARFDGVEFSRFDARNTPEFQNSAITTLCVTGDGALWIGTAGGGVVRYRDGLFTHFGEAQGLAGDDVRIIYDSNDGSLWIGTTTGMSRYRNRTFVNYTKADGLSSDNVRYITRDRDGNLWIATARGLNRLKKGGAMDSFVMPNRLPNDSVRAICQDKGGRIWIGSNNGLLWFDQYWENHFYAYNTQYGLSDMFVSAICEGRDGNLWVGTYSGLNRFYGSRFFPQLDNEGQPFGRVNVLFEDSEGDLWVGTQEGLIRLERKYFFTYTQQQGLTHNNIMSVLQDRHGSMWIGTWGGGLNKMQGGEITAYMATNSPSQDLILSLCEGRDGSIWAGADFDGGLMQMKDGKMTHYTWRDGLPNARIQALLEDKTGKLWIGTSAGLSCFNHGRFTNYTAKRELAGDNVRAIMEDHSGTLWFATDGGLNCLTRGEFKKISPPGAPDEELIALYEDKDGAIWIGTDGSGLRRFKDGRFTRYTTEQGLFSDVIFSILDDEEGWLWMSCPQGIFRVRKSDLEALDSGRVKTVSAIAYGKTDGMESPQCNGAGKPASWRSSDGRLWFPTSKGLVTIDPQHLAIDPFAPRVFIEQLTSDGKPRLSETAPFMRTAAEALRLPPGKGELEFHYTALNLSAPEKSQFKYKLEGVNADWIDAGTRRTAYYNNIEPGEYRFYVRACNKDGVWTDRPTSLSFVLTPFYWQTWWFRAAMLAVAVGAVAGVVILVARRRLERKLQLLEQQHAIEKERRRIAQDMHDQLGAGLTQIGLLGEFARRDQGHNGKATAHVQKICDVTRELAQTVDEIVWTVNPRNDTLNKLAAYLAAYAEDFFQAMPIRCRLDIPPGLPTSPLSAEVRHNVFLVVKEALNNVVKHSKATEVWIGLVVYRGALEICIEDNGAGFVVEEANASRNGLFNIRERLKEIAGTVEIASHPEKGTRVCLKVPLKEIVTNEKASH